MLKYYYIDSASKLQCGPFTPDELLRKDIRPETMVWRSGMTDWVEAGTLPELDFLFNSKAPIPPKQPIAEKVENKNESTTYTVNPQAETRQYNRSSGANNDNIRKLPKNWMVEAVIFTLICCSPVSLVGIIYASLVETRFSNHDYEGAERASQRAKMWSLAGILFWPTIYVILSIFGITFSYFTGIL